MKTQFSQLSVFTPAALVISLALSACSPRAIEAPLAFSQGPSIVGGERVLAQDPIAKSTALLYNVEMGSVCTVSILTSTWVLTAAHCVDGQKIESQRVIFATSIREPDADFKRENMRSVAEMRVNPRFAKTMQDIEDLVAKSKAEGKEITMEDVDKIKDWGDIALLRLDSPIPEGYRPVKLLPEGTYLNKGQAILLAGFGRTGMANTQTDSGILRKVVTRIEEPAWGQSEVLINQTEKKGACHGDSGGPAFAQIGSELFLFGVTSRGARDPGNTCLNFSVYTHVNAYRPMIKEAIGF